MPLTYHDIRYDAPRKKPVPKTPSQPLHILQVLKFDCAQGHRVLGDKSIFKEPRTCYSSLESLAPAAFSVASSAICRDSGEDACQASGATDTIKNTRNV
jgi:hypothetical protein